MTMAHESTDAKGPGIAAGKPTFIPPSRGVWMLDASHCERPRSTWGNAVFAGVYADGFRQGFARYGALLDTIEYAAIEGYPYTCVRPLGAPPDAKGPPPKWLFKLLLLFHPALRKRVARAKDVMEARSWREDIERFWRELPAEEARIAALAAEPIEQYDDDELVDHVQRAYQVTRERLLEHFRTAAASMVPVGDFLAHVVRWTGGPPAAGLAALRGHSAASVGGTRACEDAAAAIAADAEAAAILAGGEPAAAVLERLRARDGAVGHMMTRLLDRYGDVIVSGHDVAELRLREIPDLVVKTLRARSSATAQAHDARAAAERSAAELRAQVPEADRATFDALLAEARVAYPLRDARGGVDFWALGVMRRAMLEIGECAVRRGRLERIDDVFDCTQAELLALARGEAPPVELAQRARWRRTGKLEEAPPFLGGAPGEPPPPEWLPGGAARAAAALGVYLGLLWTEGEGGGRRDAPIRGLGASPGRRTGPARLIRSAADFERLQRGDILVAPITTPAYNVILPLLAGVVTDRGGLLSHPAIVSREYGFPGVVGAKDATARIPDGALVEIDGDAGTVKVLK
ncbi:MAG: PEP-utilizing enzyme [Sorangiineae bacterium]|nr:PEP-utilizing enzyme [Sorangiineae bacterium]